MKSANAAITLPAHIRTKIAEAQKAFAKRQRFDVDENSKLTTLTVDQKIEHFRDRNYQRLGAVREGGSRTTPDG